MQHAYLVGPGIDGLDRLVLHGWDARLLSQVLLRKPPYSIFAQRADRTLGTTKEGRNDEKYIFGYSVCKIR